LQQFLSSSISPTAQAGAERKSALQRTVLALVTPTDKRHFARGLQLPGSSTYRRAKLFESDRPA
jgi:hypothetical protein